jgi:tetratricopeptide (TPR) repeat protein
MARQIRKKSRKSRKESVNLKEPLSAIQQEPPFWKPNLFPALILALLAISLYSQTAQFDFVLDDKIVLTENKYVKEGISGIPGILGEDTFYGYFGESQNLVAGGRYRPLSLVLFAIERELFGSKPVAGHILNVLFFVLTVLLVFRMLSAMVPGKGNKWLAPAFAAALLFAAHPIHSEVVANIKGRDEILTLLGALGTLWFSWQYAKDGRMKWLIISGGVFFLALLAKENAVTFLAIVPLALWIFGKARGPRLWAPLVPMGIAFAAYLVLRYEALGFLMSGGEDIKQGLLMNNPFMEATVSEKFAMIFYSLGMYIKLLFFPHPLTHDYYPYQVPLINWAHPLAWGSLLFYVGIGLFALRELPKRTVPAFSILYYLATLSLVSNIFFPVGAPMNERFLYMPSVGFCLLLGWLLVEGLPEKFGTKIPALRIAGIILLGLFVAGFSVKTILRLPAWKNGTSLNIAASKVSVNSARAQNFMGVMYYEEATAETDKEKALELYRNAEIYIDKALKIHPEYADALMMKSGIAAGYYKYDRDLKKLLDLFLEVQRTNPIAFVDTYLEYLNGRGDNLNLLLDFYHRAGFEMFAAEKRNYDYALKYLVGYAWPLDRNNLTILRDITRVYSAKGNQAKVVEWGNRVLALSPGDEEIRKLVNKNP